MKLKPRNTLVTVVELKKGEHHTDSGLVIPSDTEREYKQCEVVAVGDGNCTHKDQLSACRDLKPGMLVLVKLHTLRQISRDMGQLQSIGINFTTDDGRALKMVEETQIVAVLEEEVVDVVSE